MPLFSWQRIGAVCYLDLLLQMGVIELLPLAWQPPALLLLMSSCSLLRFMSWAGAGVCETRDLSVVCDCPLLRPIVELSAISGGQATAMCFLPALLGRGLEGLNAT